MYMYMPLKQYVFCLYIGEINVGIPCLPYNISRVRHGTQSVTETVFGRKIPLADIHRQALKDHYQFGLGVSSYEPSLPQEVIFSVKVCLLYLRLYLALEEGTFYQKALKVY